MYSAIIFSAVKSHFVSNFSPSLSFCVIEFTNMCSNSEDICHQNSFSKLLFIFNDLQLLDQLRQWPHSYQRNLEHISDLLQLWTKWWNLFFFCWTTCEGDKVNTCSIFFSEWQNCQWLYLTIFHCLIPCFTYLLGTLSSYHPRILNEGTMSWALLLYELRHTFYYYFFYYCC